MQVEEEDVDHIGVVGEEEEETRVSIFSVSILFLSHVSFSACFQAGWQMLGERGSGAPRKVRVFYERKDPQHTLFCRET